MKETKAIIEELIEYLGVKAPSLAKEIGVRYSRVQDIQLGRTKKISLDLANKICAAYPEISKAYLLKGEGELLRSEGRNINVSHSPNSNIAGNDIHISGTPAQMMAVEAVLNDDSISKSDLFAVVRHLQAMNDKHLATIEKLTLANERLNAVLLELVAKWTSGNVTEDSLKSVLMKFDKWA
jgi:hypothetical protein